MARALLRRSTVLVMDEATASVDPETDARLQEMVRREFRGSATVLTIAHRLHTICFYDSVIVLDKGRVIEQGSPLELLRRNPPPDGFYGDLGADSEESSAAIGELRALSAASGDVARASSPCACPGAFRRLAEESGDYESLVEIAEEEQRQRGDAQY